MYNLKKIVYSFLFVFGSLTLFSVTVAGLTNQLSILHHNSQDDIMEYGCPEYYRVDVIYGSDDYRGANYRVKFDTSNILLTPSAVNSAGFSSNASGIIESPGIYRGDFSNSALYSSDIRTSRFSVKPLLVSPYISTSSLELVNKDGLAPVYSTNPSDQINVTAASVDTLMQVNNKIITFAAYPCTGDSQAPRLYNFNTDNVGVYYTVVGNNLFSNNQIVGTGRFTVLVLDVDSGNTSLSDTPFWFGGNINTGNLDNYVANPGDVDTEYGVNSSTLTVNINNSAGQNNTILNGDLDISPYLGTLTPNQYTWHSKDRGYWIEFENSDSNLFQVEKPVTITINGEDNPHRDLSTSSMNGQEFTLNHSQVPNMTSIYPVHQSTDLNPTINQIKFRVTDDWAGVDTGKVWITIPEILSGGVSLMSGRTYTSVDMSFTGYGPGLPGTGNAGGYEVTLNLDPTQIPFPADSRIQFTGMVVDLAGNTGYINLNNWYINTRKPCSYFGCNEYLDIYIMTGVNFNSGNPYVFTGGLLIATGTNPNSPYPYLTGVDNNILMCGYPWTGAIIGGNVQVEDSLGNNLMGSVYNQNEVYITGLDFTYSNGVITID